MSILPAFLIVDDDPINNLICKHVIKSSFPEAAIKDFVSSQSGLDFIRKNLFLTERGPLVLFLDINMPDVTGWEFLDEFEAFPEEIKKRFTIFILSSSIDERDKKLALNNPRVKDFIVKPLKRNFIADLLKWWE